jgi:DNA uptake protein ComE-like DNA-binding protein
MKPSALLTRVRAALRPLLLALPLALVLAACASDPDDAPDASTTDAETEETQETQAPSSATEDAMGDGARTQKVNLNEASEDDFLALPGVGENMAHEFEEYRPYVSIRQFRREIGKYVDAEQVAAYEKHVFVPVKANASDAATLQQLPGVDEAAAEALIDGRPYASREAFFDALRTHVSAEERAAAEAYVTGL